MAAVAGALATGACSGDAGVPPAVVVDSAGVRLVSYDLTRDEVPVHRVLGEANLEIGAMDGAPEYTLSRIADLALAEGGTIVVSDGVAQELRLYGPEGGYLRTVGQRGEGPGEFASAPTIAGLAGDTVFAFDARSARLTTYTLAGELLGTISLRSESIGRPDLVLRQADGTYLSRSDWFDRGARPEFYEVRLDLDSVVVERLDASGALLDTVRVMADRTQARRVMDRGGGVMSVMQAQTPYSASAVLRTDGVRPIVGRSDAFRLEVLDPDGGTEMVLRVAGVEHAATAEDIRAHQEAAIRADLGDGEIDPMTWRVNIEFLPERLPAFGQVLVGDEGDRWVSLAEYDLEEGLDWLVFTRSGGLRGRVHTPPRVRLREVRRDFVLGFVLDELDVPYVRRYPLMPPSEGGA